VIVIIFHIFEKKWRMDIKSAIITLSFMNVLFLWIHESDAFQRGEWRMFAFLSGLKEKTQYRIFLWAHVPLLLLSVYYLWTVFNFNNFPLWIVWNLLMIIHLLIHLFAKRWKTNVFHSVFSFAFIYMTAITAFAGLLLLKYY